MLLSVFQLFYVQTPAVFRNGRATQSIRGDAMYVKAFDDGTIPDTETLSLKHLPDRVRWPTVTVDSTKLNQLPTARPANTSLKSKAKDYRKIELLLSDCLRKNFNNGI